MKPRSLHWAIGAAAALLGSQAGAGGQQLVEASPAALSASRGAEVVVGATYTTSDANPALTGLGLRIHFNSAALRWVGLDRVLQTGLVGAAAQPAADSADFDGDPATDAYVTVAWAAPAGGWPGGGLPADLVAARFEALGSGSTRVNFSSSSTASGYGLSAASAAVTIQP